MRDVHEMTIAEKAQRLRSGELTASSLLESYLERIERLDRHLHSFVRFFSEEAHSQARRIDAEIRSGNYRGPLHGMPIAVKDVFACRGSPTIAQSRAVSGHPDAEDAEAVRRLRDAGAIILGKLATFEFAVGSSTEDIAFPPALNPWDLTRRTTGSSSGSAVAAAAGLCAGTLATDTGGSIRFPAGYCGVAGLKPTNGRVSRRGVTPLSFTLDTCGPIAWTVEDCALILQAIAGYDPRDVISCNEPVVDYGAQLRPSLKGVKIGHVKHFYDGPDGADAEVTQAIDAALEVMRSLGAEVQEVRLPDPALFHACGRIILIAEGYAVHRDNLAARVEQYGVATRGRLLLGAFVETTEYIDAQRLRLDLIRRTDEAMAPFDVLVTATNYSGPPKQDGESTFTYFDKPFLTTPFNITGQPALGLCCGFNDEGLPLSLQIIGKRFDEAAVLRVGHAYERATTWRNVRPPYG